MFDIELPPLPETAPPEEVIGIDDLVEEPLGVVEPVRWSEYLPDGMLADLLVHPVEVDAEHREFEALERVGGWERVIAWAQARQAREMTAFMDRAEARNLALGACDSQAHESAVAEVGLMLRVSARTAACRVGDAWSLCTRLPATLAALESGQITLAKARVVDAETLEFVPGAHRAGGGEGVGQGSEADSGAVAGRDPPRGAVHRSGRRAGTRGTGPAGAWGPDVA